MATLNPNERKDRGFFAEFIVATVLAILAASLWHDLLVQIIPERNIIILTTICIIITISSVFLLEYLFSDRKREDMSKLTYLKQYEDQDWYRENPSMWPISEIPPTVKYEIRRRKNEDLKSRSS